MRFKDRSGQVVGGWRIEGPAPPHEKNGQFQWHARCLRCQRVYVKARTYFCPSQKHHAGCRACMDTRGRTPTSRLVTDWLAALRAWVTEGEAAAVRGAGWAGPASLHRTIARAAPRAVDAHLARLPAAVVAACARAHVPPPFRRRLLAATLLATDRLCANGRPALLPPLQPFTGAPWVPRPHATMGRPVADLAGRTINGWVVEARLANDQYGKVVWRCRCAACGQVCARPGQSFTPSQAGKRRCPRCRARGEGVDASLAARTKRWEAAVRLWVEVGIVVASKRLRVSKQALLQMVNRLVPQADAADAGLAAVQDAEVVAALPAVVDLTYRQRVAVAAMVLCGETEALRARLARPWRAA